MDLSTRAKAALVARVDAGGASRMPRDIYVLALISLIVSMGFGIVGPSVPLLATEFNASAWQASLAISAFSAFRLASALGLGGLIDRLGERRILVSGLGIQAFTSALAGLAITFEWFLTFRAISGIGSAAFSISSMALLLRLAPPDRRGRSMAIYQGGGIMGAILGPAMGGLFADIDPRLPMLIYAVFLVLAAVVGVKQLNTDPRPGSIAAEAGTPHIEERLQYENVEENVAVTEPVHVDNGPAQRKAFWRIYIAALAANLAGGWVFYGMRNSLVPIYIHEELHKSALWMGMAFLLAAVVQGLTLLRSGWLADVIGRKFAMALGLSIGLGSLLIMMMPTSALVFLIPMVTFGIAAALMATAPAAMLADVAHGRGGKVIAGFSMMSDIGAIVGPQVVGHIADTWSFEAAFGASAIVILIALIPTLLLPNRRTHTVA